ncbi:MAG: SCO family protein, partial [Verrucomicrobiota bacterium]
MKAYPLITTLLLAFIVTGLFFIPRSGRKAEKPVVAALPDLGPIPDFSLVAQNGEPFGREDLEGRIWVANFIFTRCLATCPLQTENFARMFHRAQIRPNWDDVLFLSFSVDPGYDTPEVLRAYAEDAGSDGRRWLFLPGDRDAIWTLSRDGLKLAVGETPPEQGGPIFHSSSI